MSGVTARQRREARVALRCYQDFVGELDDLREQLLHLMQSSECGPDLPLDAPQCMMELADQVLTTWKLRTVLV